MPNITNKKSGVILSRVYTHKANTFVYSFVMFRAHYPFARLYAHIFSVYFMHLNIINFKQMGIEWNKAKNVTA